MTDPELSPTRQPGNLESDQHDQSNPHPPGQSFQSTETATESWSGGNLPSLEALHLPSPAELAGEESTWNEPVSRMMDRSESWNPLRPIMRMFWFISFLLTEYLISGRILVETIAIGAFYVLFLRSDTQIDASKFFSLTSIFMLGLTIYTMSMVMNMANRPQNYMVLARRLSRSGFLISLYFIALIILVTGYALLSAVTISLSTPQNLDLTNWFLGSLPLLLNVGVLLALLLMLSPLACSPGWRLLVMGLIAMAFSGSFVGSSVIEQLPDTFRRILSSLQTIFSWPLVPAFSGYVLSVQRDYTNNAFAILLAQASLLIALLGLAVYAFSRREIIFHDE
ncbi:MAG: hypothetical protein HC837_15170 [Chloroflexaceae bacterium]|nr:hypothetical protein [Chloroflexaceae bacterium]